jgi:hypothetical protein
MLLAFFACVGVSSTAWATNVLLLEPSADGPLGAAELGQLRTSARAALRAVELQEVPSNEVDNMIAGEPQLKGCYTEQCLERLGRLLDAQIIVRYRGKPLAGSGAAAGGWHLNIQLLDVEIGAFGVTTTEDCAGCTIKQASDKLSEMIKRAVLENASRPRGILQVESNPPSAAVFVDGTELGITPYQRAAFVGKHAVVVRHIGYRSEQVAAEVADGQTRRLAVQLVPGNDAVRVVVVEREKSPVYKKWWFWVAIGGAAVAAAGITAAVVLSMQSQAPADRMVPMNTFNF